MESQSKEHVKKSLIKFCENLTKYYNDELGCFMMDREEILEEFEDLLDMLEHQ